MVHTLEEPVQRGVLAYETMSRTVHQDRITTDYLLGYYDSSWVRLFFHRDLMSSLCSSKNISVFPASDVFEDSFTIFRCASHIGALRRVVDGKNKAAACVVDSIDCTIANGDAPYSRDQLCQKHCWGLLSRWWPCGSLWCYKWCQIIHYAVFL